MKTASDHSHTHMADRENERRKERNRKAARASRLKKNTYISRLETENIKMREIIKILLSNAKDRTLCSFKTKFDYDAKETSHMRTLLHKGTRTDLNTSLIIQRCAPTNLQNFTELFDINY